MIEKKSYPKTIFNWLFLFWMVERHIQLSKILGCEDCHSSPTCYFSPLCSVLFASFTQTRAAAWAQSWSKRGFGAGEFKFGVGDLIRWILSFLSTLTSSCPKQEMKIISSCKHQQIPKLKKNFVICHWMEKNSICDYMLENLRMDYFSRHSISA